MVKSQALVWVQTLALSLNSYVALSKLLSLSVLCTSQQVTELLCASVTPSLMAIIVVLHKVIVRNKGVSVYPLASIVLEILSSKVLVTIFSCYCPGSPLEHCNFP